MSRKDLRIPRTSVLSGVILDIYLYLGSGPDWNGGCQAAATRISPPFAILARAADYDIHVTIQSGEKIHWSFDRKTVQLVN
jgi:hypothetical protein